MSGAGGAAAAQAAIQNAIKASGAIVRIEANDFKNLIAKMDSGLVIEKQGGSFLSSYKYSTSYKGFIFYCRSKEQIVVPAKLEKINARAMWVPQ